jgi:flagellar hook-basal body complex protein FliE
MVNKNMQAANKTFNSFAKMSPAQIMSHAQQVNNATQTSTQPGTLAQTVGTIAKSVQNDENVKKRSLVGDASLSEVIEATSEAKTTLQTAIAVRNKLIESWNQIMNMPI